MVSTSYPPLLQVINRSLHILIQHVLYSSQKITSLLGLGVLETTSLSEVLAAVRSMISMEIMKGFASQSTHTPTPARQGSDALERIL